jgi:hypothetical protein
VQFLTDFADQAVLLPLAVAIGLVLALSGWWRGVLAWCVAVGSVLVVMAVLKVVFFACDTLLGTPIHSPSGHTAASAVVLGGAVILYLRGRAPVLLVAAIPVAVAAVFAVTRLEIHAHSVPEVLIGGAVGLAGTAVLAVLAGPRPPMRAWPAVVAALAIMVALHGVRLQAEQALHSPFLLDWLPVPAMCRA